MPSTYDRLTVKLLFCDLDADEKLDIAEYALPNRFRKKLIEKGFDVTTSDMQTFKEEVRNFEDVEELDTGWLNVLFLLLY